MVKPVLRLYLAGNTATAARAKQNLDRLCGAIGSCDVEIIDVLSQPQLAEAAGVLATPMLSYEDAMRPRRVVGDISDTKRVLEFLGIDTKDQQT
jgi:circadian clock protein KaiB